LAPFLDTILEKCRALGTREWVIDDSTEFLALLDEQRITQALLQLAQNAVRHTGEGDEIALGSRVTAQHGIELWVRDTGSGVDDDEKERIFDRFTRGQASRDDEGFGLGLSIVTAIAGTHGGTISVSDAPGGGAIFTLTLPVHRKDDAWPAS
ncbi:MAG: sensor histidine kinase, partial [Nocardioides sp.]